MAENVDKEALDQSTQAGQENNPNGTLLPEKTDLQETTRGASQAESRLSSIKWSAYFLEFTMIFLAVTLGFIADSIRERLEDRSKEKQYIIGFIHNLKEDTLNLKYVIERGKRQVKGIDSMLTLAHADMAIDSNRRLFYYYFFTYCYSKSTFESNDATLQQLKSTGDYGLIEKEQVAASLAKFDSDLQSIYAQGDYYELYFKEILSRIDEVADVTVLGDTAYVNKGKMLNKPFPHLRIEEGQQTTLFNKLFVFKLVTRSYIEDFLVKQLNTSNRLIHFLKNKYKLPG